MKPWMSAPLFLLIVSLAIPQARSSESPNEEWDYYDAPLSQVILDPEDRLDTTFPSVGVDQGIPSLFVLALQRAEVDQGEAWIGGRVQDGGWSTTSPANWRLVGRVKKGSAAEGTLFLVQPGPRSWAPQGWKLKPVAFRWPQGNRGEEKDFVAARNASLDLQERMDLPGREWFRARKDHSVNLQEAATLRRRRLEGDFQRSFSLFSGSQAMQEALQVDRALALDESVDAESTETTRIEDIEGITVPEVDWASLLKEVGAGPVTIEVLAHWVPEDQVLVSLPNFGTLVKLLDELDVRGTDLLQWFEERSEDAASRAFLEQQLCLELSPLARELGKRLVRSVALTTSDGYVREGTDVTVLMECDQPAAVLLQVEALRARARKLVPGCADQEFVHGDVTIHGVASPDRAISSYHAVVGDVLMIGNSPVAIRRLLDARAGKVASHGLSEEYRFFRHRYPWDVNSDKALITLSDAFLRRFCGPEWRIAESRRVRCQENLAALDCGSRLHEGFTFVSQVIDAPCPSPETTYQWNVLGTTWEEGFWTCRLHGRRGFLTPIAETPVRKVTQAERRAYDQFRDRYQSYWTRVFDPVVLELDLGRHLEADLTVMPLIAGTDYREMRDWTGGGALKPGAGDPHDALFHMLLHVNRESREFRQMESAFQFVPGMEGEGLRWVGDSVELFVDPDPVLDTLADEEDVEDWVLEHLGELPFGARVAVRDPLHLGLFLVALRGMADTVAPGLMLWETRQWQDVSYVAIQAGPSAAQLEEELTQLGIFYVVHGGALTVTMNEAMLQRSLDRSLARASQQVPETDEAAVVRSHSGDHAQLTLRIEDAMVAMDGIFGFWQDAGLQTCLTNAPILTEWMVRHADEDPLAVHEGLFHATPTCPRGGEYTFDKDRLVVHCSKHGSAFEPRRSSGVPAGLEQIRRVLAGLTFEHDGVRLHLRLENRDS